MFRTPAGGAAVHLWLGPKLETQIHAGKFQEEKAIDENLLAVSLFAFHLGTRSFCT
jgi:hypothetical protein